MEGTVTIPLSRFKQLEAAEAAIMDGKKSFYCDGITFYVDITDSQLVSIGEKIRQLQTENSELRNLDFNNKVNFLKKRQIWG